MRSINRWTCCPAFLAASFHCLEQFLFPPNRRSLFDVHSTCLSKVLECVEGQVAERLVPLFEVENWFLRDNITFIQIQRPDVSIVKSIVSRQMPYSIWVQHSEPKGQTWVIRWNFLEKEISALFNRKSDKMPQDNSDVYSRSNKQIVCSLSISRIYTT